MTDLAALAAAYERAASTPTVAGGRLDRVAGTTRARVAFAQRDLRDKRERSFARLHVVPDGSTAAICAGSAALGGDVCLEERRADGSGIAFRVVKLADEGAKGKGGDKQLLQLAREQSALTSLDASELHGPVYNDELFGGAVWSEDGRKVLYVAEAKRPKTAYYWASTGAGAAADDGPDRLGSFAFKEDYGEDFDGKSLPRLFVATVGDDGQLSSAPVEGLPADMACGQAVFAPGSNANTIVFTGWPVEPRRLGLRSCYNRQSAIYKLDLATSGSAPERISPAPGFARCPVFDPSGSRLIYITSGEVTTHDTCEALHALSWPALEHRVVVDYVDAPAAFPGIFAHRLHRRCFVAPSRVVLCTAWRSQTALITIDIDSGAVSRLSIPGADAATDAVRSWVLLDVCAGGRVLAASSHPGEASSVVLLQIDAAGELAGPAIEVDRAVAAGDAGPLAAPVTTQVLKVVPKTAPGDAPFEFETILVHPSSATASGKLPLVLIPHGGPHVVFPTAFSAGIAFLANLGYGVTVVNYRGSAGFGRAALESLPGNIGTNDIGDVQDALAVVLETGMFDPKRVAVVGGSHGGFLAGHAAGQFPDSYRVAVLRNPVTNISTMVGASDIPDWCLCEAGYSGADLGLASESPEKVIAQMFRCSPMAHIDKVAIPCLVTLGLTDRRVPNEQGYQWYYALKARGKPTKLLTYPETGHSIGKVDCSADEWLNVVVYLQEHGV